MNEIEFSAPVKKFMDAALPSAVGGHVLALGNLHQQRTNHKFVITHMDALIRDHNLGTIGYEMPPYMDVFMWAYKQKKLPVSEESAPYYVCYMVTRSCSKRFHPQAQSAANEMLIASDQGVQTVCFDARMTLKQEQDKLSGHIKLLEQLFLKNPNLREQLRANPKLIDGLSETVLETFPNVKVSSPATFDDGISRAFVVLEVQSLCKKNPHYKRWIENIEAVADAAKRRHLGEDAVSAAILNASSDPKRNIITHNGIGHLTGAANEELRAQGTFAKHLSSAGLNVSSAIVMDAGDVPFFTNYLPTLSENAGKAGVSALALPPRITFGAVDAHQAFETAFDKARKSYQPTGDEKFGREYLQKTQGELKHSSMVSKLTRLSEPRDYFARF